MLDKRHFHRTIGVDNFHYVINFNCKQITILDIQSKQNKSFAKTILGGIKMVKIGIITGSTRDSRVNITSGRMGEINRRSKNRC